MKHKDAPPVAGEAAFTGAQQVIRRCLGLVPGQELLVFVDETTVEVATVIAEAAYSLEIPHTLILVPVALQRRIPHEIDLSLLTVGVAKEARAILTCVNGEPDCLPFRDHILKTQWSARTRIGHMPGASLEVLESANMNFDRLIADCRRLEVALARGRTLDFTSYAADGTQHYLTVDINGWERLPVASDGVISDGIWGNVPSGETYIAPVEGSAEGSVVINGSIPGLLIDPDSAAEIVLHFEQGRMVRIEPPDSPTAHWLHKTQIEIAQAKGDQNWSNLAEIGIGVNPAVDRLTGNMLFDEKAAGTAHVALGSNTFMGGTVDGVIHCDMVVNQPTIVIDGKIVLDHGKLRVNEADWRENYQQISLADSPMRSAIAVARSGVETTASIDGRLQRILRPEPGRVSNCFVGDDETARLAYDLDRCLPDEGGWVSIKKLTSRTRMKHEMTQQVLHVMWDYGLIGIRSLAEERTAHV